MENSTIYNIISASLIGGAGLVYVSQKRLRRLFEPRKRNHGNSRDMAGNDDAMNKVYKSFIMYADVFQGIYEPMFQASSGKVSQERIKNVFTEWDIRMNSIKNIPIELRGWWSTIIANKDVLPYEKLQQQAVKVIRLVEQSGIIRDQQLEMFADNNTNQYYQHVDGIVFELGQRLRVESPCWYISTNPVRIIEKGYCEIL